VRIVVVLGAGASLANALHFHAQRMQSSRPPLDTTFFDVMQGLGIAFTTPLHDYLAGLLGHDPTSEDLRQLRMEDFFKDLYFDFQESPGSTRLRTAYTDLVLLYQRVLRETTNWLCKDSRTGAPIGRLLAAAADHADEVTIVTFNHDLVIENEIYRRARLRPRWCIERGYGTFSDGVKMAVPTSSSVRGFPAHDDDVCDHSRPIEVLKLHGSLNWTVRLGGSSPTARTLSGEAGARDVYVVTFREAMASLAWSTPRARGRGRRTWDLWPVIIPPIYAKQALRRRVQQVWSDAHTALKECSRVVFFGYSLPMIDIEAEKLFERGIAENRKLKWADVINPDPASAQRYAGLKPVVPIRWYPSPEYFIDADTFSG
jgi:hypothetical protein